MPFKAASNLPLDCQYRFHPKLILCYAANVQHHVSEFAKPDKKSLLAMIFSVLY
jgi:hypothetical protein